MTFFVFVRGWPVGRSIVVGDYVGNMHFLLDVSSLYRSYDYCDGSGFSDDFVGSIPFRQPFAKDTGSGVRSSMGLYEDLITYLQRWSRRVFLVVNHLGDSLRLLNSFFG